MVKVTYEVKVWVGGTDDIPAIGLSGGVCTWSREIGILHDEWWGNISSMIDVSSSGNYETYSPTSVEIVKNKIVEKTLNNYGLTLTGKRIEIHEITTAVRVLYRGVIDKMTSSGNTVKIAVSHLTNKYNTNLTNKVGKDYSYLVYGSNVDGVPLVVDKDAVSLEIGTLGADEYYPAFRNITTEQDERYMLIEPVYDKSLVSYDDIVEFFEKSQYFMIEESESYVATLFRVNDGDTITIEMAIKPCRYKISTGEEAIPLDSVAIVKYAYPSSIYYPTGSDVDKNSIVLESGNVVPFYIDSIEYKSDSAQLLDADDVGFSYVAPKRTRFANDQELKELNGDAVILAGAQGVSIYSDVNTSITAKSATSANGENLGYRESSPVSNASIDLTGGINGLGFGYISYSFTGAYDIESPEDYEQLNCSMEATLKDVKALAAQNVFWRWDITSKIMVKTVGGIRDISTSLTETDPLIGDGSNSITVDDFKLPLTVASDVVNRSFRFSNESMSQRLWYSVDLFSELEEYEKKNPITVFYIVTVGTGMTRENVNMLATLESMKINVFSQYAYSLDELTANNVDGKAGVDTIADMYIDSCSRQNFSRLGFAVPSSGWGLDIPSGDITTVVNTADINANAPTDIIKYKTETTNTKAVKTDLLRYGFGLGFIDQSGLESWADLLSMYNDGGVNITAYEVVGKPAVVGFNSNRVYCDIGITTHEGNFNIFNTEQDTGSYDASFTEGFEVGVGKKLWLLGNILYKKYGVKNEYLKSLGDVDAIVDEEKYVRNQYAIAGAVEVGDATVLYDRYTLKISLSTEFVISNDLWKGSNIVFTFPHIASLHTGIITGMSKDISKEVYTITAEMVGDVLDSTEVFTIIESGSQADNIIESGSQVNNYVEAV